MVKSTRGYLNNVLLVSLQKFAYGCLPVNFIEVDLSGEKTREGGEAIKGK